MALFEYLSMAFASIKSNKMRSLLTMLGIIIGIAAVIAIETVGNSLSSSVSDSMSGTGASSITVSLTQKSSSNSGSSSGGVRLRLFKNSVPLPKLFGFFRYTPPSINRRPVILYCMPSGRFCAVIREVVSIRDRRKENFKYSPIIFIVHLLSNL